MRFGRDQAIVRAPRVRNGGNMQDLIFTILTVLFFVASLAYVYACERLR